MSARVHLCKQLVISLLSMPSSNIARSCLWLLFRHAFVRTLVMALIADAPHPPSADRRRLTLRLPRRRRESGVLRERRLNSSCRRSR